MSGKLTLFPEFGLSLLYSGKNHISNAGSGEPVQAGVDSFDGNNIQVLGARVVSTVHDSSCGECTRHLEFDTNGSGATLQVRGVEEKGFVDQTAIGDWIL